MSPAVRQSPGAASQRGLLPNVSSAWSHDRRHVCSMFARQPRYSRAVRGTTRHQHRMGSLNRGIRGSSPGRRTRLDLGLCQFRVVS
jgi:hypothetical protein